MITRTLVIFLAVMVPSSLTRAADWPNWRGPNRDGISEESNLNFDWLVSGPPILWHAMVGTGFSSMAISDGRLHTIGNADEADTVVCLDAESGRKIWSHTYPCPLDPNLFEGGPTSTPTVDGDHVYTISRLGHLFCFNAQDGKIVWSRNLVEDTEIPPPGWGYAGSPVVHDNTLLLNIGESGMAVDKLTGQTLWASEPEESGYTTPVTYIHEGKTLAIFSSGKYFSAVDVGNGSVVWSHRWLTRYGMNACDPIVIKGHIFITSGYGKGATLLEHATEEPKEIWKEKVLRAQISVPVLLGDFIYGIDGDVNAHEPVLKCIDFMTGKEVWTNTDVGSGSFIVADGTLIILTTTGELIAGRASPNGWEKTARAKVLDGKCWTPPALANGRLYCRNADGKLVCLELRKK